MVAFADISYRVELVCRVRLARQWWWSLEMLSDIVREGRHAIPVAGTLCTEIP
jgi:hypothetical protein